jgi:HK97 family phage portal protein
VRLNPFQRSASAEPGYPRIRSENNIFYAAGSPTPSELRVQFSEGEEQRAITSLPWDRGGPVSNSTVDTDRALTLVPVYAAVRLLADTIASLPLHLYRKTKDGIPEEQPDPSLLVKPEINGHLYDWLHRLVTGLALRGNAYGSVTARDSYGIPTMIEWLDPDMVYVLDKAFSGPGSFLQPQWFWRGIPMDRQELVHIPWFTLPWRVQGFSPITAYAMTANTGLAAQQYSNDWFASGGVPPGKFKNSAKTIDETEANQIKQRLTNSIRQRKPLVYGSDWDYELMATPPNEAQFIETLRLTATQIAAIYGIPPEMIGGTTGTTLAYTTEEHRALDFVTFGLQPWLTKIEQAISALFPRPQYVKFSTDILVRQDTQARHTVYKLDTEIGLRTANEMRAAEGWKPLETPLPIQLPGHELTPLGSENPPSGGGGTLAQPTGGKPAPAPNRPVDTTPSANGHR